MDSRDFANATFRVRVIDVAGSTWRDFFLDWVAVRPHYAASAPAGLSAVSVSPSTVTGGNPSTGTVTFDRGGACRWVPDHAQ